MTTTMIEERLRWALARVDALQAQRIECRRESLAVVGSEEDCAQASARHAAVEAEYIRALEAAVLDARVLLVGRPDRRAA